MHKIRTNGVAFNGQVGPVRFTDGVAHTDSPSMVAHFQRDPDRYTVSEPWPEDEDAPEQDELDEDGEDEAPEGDEGQDEPDPEDATEGQAEQTEGELVPEGDGEPDGGTREGEGDPSADPYDANVSVLRKLASRRNLSTAGSKAELQERLREADAEQQS